MAEQPERLRPRPTVEGRARLLAAIQAAGQPHVVDAGTLGEYAELVAVRGQAHADATLPEVAAHLASGCAECAADARELVAMTSQPEFLAPPPLPIGTAAKDDSGIYAADLPNPRAEEEAARLRKLRRLREWLLVAAAVAILLIGLSLVGLAYVASSQPGVQIGLTPLPATPPTPAGGRPAPSGMTCPASHPIKGNRSSRLYHAPGGEFYDATRPEECFAAPADAEAAGYRRSSR